MCMLAQVKEKEIEKQRKVEQERRQGDYGPWRFSPFHNPSWVHWHHWIWLFNLTFLSVFYFKLTWVGFCFFATNKLWLTEKVVIYCPELHRNQEIPRYICCTMRTPCQSASPVSSAEHNTAPTPVILSEVCMNVDPVVLLNTIKIIYEQIRLLIKMSKTKNKHIVYSMKT